VRVAAKGLAVAAALAVLGACARTPRAEDTPPTPVAAQPVPAAPVDHLAPGELVEGLDSAFGLKLPRRMQVDRRFAQVIYASGPADLHPLAKYFRSRLAGGTLDEDDTSLTFDHVHIQDQSGREFRIRVTRAISGVRVEIRDTTPTPAPNFPDEAARWKAVGLTPTGRLLDPTHLE
jgi:hypothetical protein